MLISWFLCVLQSCGRVSLFRKCTLKYLGVRGLCAYDFPSSVSAKKVFKTLLWVKLCPLKRSVEDLTLYLWMRCWKWSPCRWNQVKIRSHCIRVGPKYNDQCPHKKRDIWRPMNTQRRRPRDSRGRDGSDAAINQKMPGTSNQHQKLDIKHGTDSSSSPQKEPCLLTSWF